MPPTIQVLAERVIGKVGSEYFRAWRELKAYQLNTSIVELLAEVRRVDNTDAFRILWSLGLPLEVQRAISERWEEIK